MNISATFVTVIAMRNILDEKNEDAKGDENFWQHANYLTPWFQLEHMRESPKAVQRISDFDTHASISSISYAHHYATDLYFKDYTFYDNSLFSLWRWITILHNDRNTIVMRNQFNRRLLS